MYLETPNHTNKYINKLTTGDEREEEIEIKFFMTQKISQT